MSKNQSLRVERKVYRNVGPSTYAETGETILNNRLKLLSAPELVSLLHQVYCSQDNEFRQHPKTEFISKKVMQDNLWVFNRNLWTPKNAKNAGVYVQFDEQVKGMSERLQTDQLEDLLSGGSVERGVRFSKDGKTAFAPYSSIPSGYYSEGRLTQNGFVIASYGAEGAEKLNAIAKTFTPEPYVFLVDNSSESNTQSLSTLCVNWFIKKLGVYGVWDVRGKSGYALGMHEFA